MLWLLLLALLAVAFSREFDTMELAADKPLCKLCKNFVDFVMKNDDNKAVNWISGICPSLGELEEECYFLVKVYANSVIEALNHEEYTPAEFCGLVKLCPSIAEEK